jgi:large subunit ribosomal protein L17
MRHRKGGKKLNRTREHRKAMFENMTTALLEYGRIETTVAKAKALRSFAEKVITRAKNSGSLHSRKIIYSMIPKQEVVKKLFSEIAPAFKYRPGGYTRVIRTHTRRGDAAEMAIIELVNFEIVPKPVAGEKPEKAAKPEKKEKPAKEEKKEKAPNNEKAAKEEKVEK